MKILVISNLYPPDICGGYELACRQAVDALRSRGHEVRVLTSAPRVPVENAPGVNRALALSDLWDPYSDSQSAPVTRRLRESQAFQVNAFNVHALLANVEEFQPDVVYLWMIVGLGGLGLLGCLHHLRLPWVWHLMDEVPAKLCLVFDRVQPELARELSRQLRGTFLACSRQLVDDIERQGVDLGEDVEIVANWVCEPFPPLRTRFHAPGERLRIVAAAATISRDYDKGIDLLIRSAGLLRESGCDRFTLDIYGNVTDSLFAELIRAHDLGAHVHLQGRLPQSALIEAYQGYDVFAFPGRPDEPFGFAPLEAMLSGCVPILSWTGGNAEWAVHGVYCLKAPRTAEGFAGALRQILAGELALEPIGRRAAAAIRTDFQLETQLPRIENALQTAAARPRNGAGTAAEAYRLAILAEKLSHIFVQESFCA